MSCPDGTAHHYEPKILDGVDYMICSKCNHVAPFRLVPSYAELLTENKRLREANRKLTNKIKEYADRQLDGG